MNKKFFGLYVMISITLFGTEMSSFRLREPARRSSQSEGGGSAGQVEGQGEFTKKSTRKDKAQQEAAYSDCVQLIDMLIEETCKLQQRLADLTGRLYKKLRACAVEEKPDLMHKETPELRKIERGLQGLKKQLQELETALNATEKLL